MDDGFRIISMISYYLLMGEFEILRDALLLTVLWNFFYSLGQAVFPWTAKICIGNYINNFRAERKRVG